MTQAWYPFYWSDYSGKTFHLTQGQHGAYMLLLRFIYTTEKPIADKERYSIGGATTDPERENVDSVLAAFFQKKGDLWYNKKALETIAIAKDKHKRRVLSGAKGGMAKSSNAKAMLDGEANNAVARAHGTTTTTTTKKDSGTKVPSSPPTPKEPKVSLDALSVDHIRDWLADQRAKGRYLKHDEHFVLEQFKNYCQSKGKRYADYVAGYRNAFEWERCQPKPDGQPRKQTPFDRLVSGASRATPVGPQT